MSRFARKIDANHGDIAAALERVGCSVLSLAPLGRGAPDMLVGAGGRDWKIEIKDGEKAPSARRLQENQVIWGQNWRGSPVHLVTSVDEALKLAELFRMVRQ